MAAADPTTRRMVATAAALTRWSKTDGKEGTAAARAGFRSRFERQVDPDGTLPAGERVARADRAMRAHMLQLSTKSRAKRAAA